MFLVENALNEAIPVTPRIHETEKKFRQELGQPYN
jgi:hypothetical protein